MVERFINDDRLNIILNILIKCQKGGKNGK